MDELVYSAVYRDLKCLHLTESDEFARFQNTHIVCNDDIGDCSTNEPTMDGTAGAIVMMGYSGTPDPTALHPRHSTTPAE